MTFWMSGRVFGIKGLGLSFCLRQEMWYQLLKPLLFRLDPEFSHDITLNTLKILQKLKALDPIAPIDASQSISCFGLTFPNPVGLAAGLDKNGECIAAWQSMGFGFIEVGTVTPESQQGNCKPRLFRSPADDAIINRMGFNNKGVDYLLQRVAQTSRTGPLGINIGKNLNTPIEKALEDYLIGFQKVYPYADYITINLSSPNTPNLRLLQHGEMFSTILTRLKAEQHRLSQDTSRKVPILVKISPDLEKFEVSKMVDQLVKLQIEGIIATNTTVHRAENLRQPFGQEAGGLSGQPLFERSTDVVRWIA